MTTQYIQTLASKPLEEENPGLQYLGGSIQSGQCDWHMSSVNLFVYGSESSG
jgi:hypothetical protein